MFYSTGSRNVQVTNTIAYACQCMRYKEKSFIALRLWLIGFFYLFVLVKEDREKIYLVVKKNLGDLYLKKYPGVAMGPV
jgi:hypothetical protein